MRTAIHLNLRVDPTQYISQIREVPRYDYIHLVREPRYMTDISLINEKVYYLNEIFSPKDYCIKHNVSLLHAHHGQLGVLLLPLKAKTQLPLVTSFCGRDATLADQPADYLDNMKLLFDHVSSFSREQDRPLELFKDLRERGFLDSFLKQVKAIDRKTYAAWTKKPIPLPNKGSK
ncbi:hypothetical protein QNH39_23950 [Neobacillus novalis]|uniref:Uncharacterized protein n=1 Tax=Neobacillus novalis TaxID=220687 RepID=A0AA95MPD1_9BACI|nr:hypothetical protein [Neobacillus novalis]WHY85628.1 hypothetical protein QNH39_23950 [Neobacillus novalis]